MIFNLDKRELIHIIFNEINKTFNLPETIELVIIAE